MGQLSLQARVLFVLMTIAYCCEANSSNPLIIDSNTLRESQNATSIPFLMQKDLDMEMPPEHISDKDKEKMEKGLKTGISKSDTDYSKLFELLGKDVEHFDNYIVVRNNAILKNRDAYILADEITYNTQLRQAKLNGNVRIYKDNSLFVYTQNAVIYLSINFSILRPFYAQDTKTGIWASSSSSSQQKNVYKFANSLVSGCSYSSPAWRIESSKGSYDSERNTLALWSPMIYIGDIPVFYLPYIKLSLNNERSSGLLYPTLASSSTDGFTYIQPYYLALQDFWDMTISPQVRTSRGGGVNFEFRAVDKDIDKYLLHVRYFYNSDDYVRTLSLANQHVYGFDFKHTKRDVIQKYFGIKSSIDNGMFFDLAFMNDIDYMRLNDVNYSLNTTNYVSKINLYAQTSQHYFGINLRYYLNLQSPNDNTTLQDLPVIQYHKYLSRLFLDELLYSINYQMKNANRSEGYSYVSNELYVPIGMQFSLLNKYFSLGAWLNIKAGNVYSYNTENTLVFKQTNYPESLTDAFGNYANLNFKVSANSDVGRRYGNFFHSLQTSLVFNAPVARASYSDGSLSPEIISTFSALDQNLISAVQNGVNIYDPTIFSNAYQTQRILDLVMSNYIYNSKGKEIFYWRLLQTFNFDDTVSPVRTPMENKLGTTPIDGLNLSISFFYSWFYNDFTELGVNASYSKNSFSASISYYLKRDDTSWNLDPVTMVYRAVDASNYLSASIKGDLLYFGIVADLSYDFSSNNIINLGIGIYKDIKCFGVGLKAGSNRTPILSEGNTISVIDNIYVKAEFKFAPLTTFGYTYRLRPRITSN